MKFPASLEVEGPKIRSLKPNRRVLDKGTQVFVGALPAIAAERFVRAWAAMSGQKMDWCYQGGRMFVLALGDLDQVEWARPFMMAAYEAMNA